MHPSSFQEVVVGNTLTVLTRTYSFSRGDEVGNVEETKQRLLVIWAHGLDSSLKNEGRVTLETIRRRFDVFQCYNHFNSQTNETVFIRVLFEKSSFFRL